jgi:hypothetical protein
MQDFNLLTRVIVLLGDTPCDLDKIYPYFEAMLSPPSGPQKMGVVITYPTHMAYMNVVCARPPCQFIF